MPSTWPSLFRSDVDLIGVGVGSFGSGETSPFVYKTGTPYRTVYQKRATWTYERRRVVDLAEQRDFEAAPLTSTVNFQKVRLTRARSTSRWLAGLQVATAFQTTNRFQNKVDFEIKSGSWKQRRH